MLPKTLLHSFSYITSFQFHAVLCGRACAIQVEDFKFLPQEASTEDFFFKLGLAMAIMVAKNEAYLS